MKKRGIYILLLVLLYSIFALSSAYAADTCGNSNEDLVDFLEASQYAKINELLKVKEHRRIKCAIYDREDLGTCIAVFERKLFGARWEYTGMDMLCESGLQAEGKWHNTGIGGSKCEIIICGDNRDGSICSYVMTDCSQVARNNLEADYIVDIYILDGIKTLPTALQQHTVEGTVFISCHNPFETDEYG